MSDSAYDSLSNFFGDLLKPDSAAELRKYAMAFAGLVLAAAIIYISATDPNAQTDNFYLYTMFGILPVVVGIMIISPLFSGPIDTKKMCLFGGILFAFIMAMYFFYRIMNPTSVGFVTNIMLFLSFLGFIVGLAIIYRVFVRSIINSKGWIGFVLKLLFLIPCLLTDTMESLFAELKSAPRMVVVLFVLEILIVLAYIYLPSLFKVNSSNSIVLLNKPVFLSKSSVIGKSDQFKIDVTDRDNPGKNPDLIRTHYSISMWIYVNQHSTSYAAYAKETNIFRYGMVNGFTGNPRLSYYNDTSDKNATDKYVLYPTNSDATDRILLDMPAQSWNQVVVSYADTTIDVFLNGDLVKSVPVSTDKMPKYTMSDVVEVGHGDNTVTRGGLHGAICNVVYYKRPLTASEVATDYNLNRYNSPPVNNKFND